MVHSLSDPARLALYGAVGLIVIAGATIDLILAFLVQQRSRGPSLPHLRDLKARPFDIPHAFLVLMVTLLFVASALVTPAGAPTPSEVTLIAGPLFYALAGLLVTSVCLFLSGTTFREAFVPRPHTTSRTFAKGILFGLAALPPVILLSLGMSSATESLGIEPRLQEVFDWLEDGSVSTGTRVFMMAAAVVIAPVVEETLFRGILFPALLKRRSFASAALLSGLYFALIHLHAPSLIPLLALSIAFSAAYAATGSLLAPIVMHALFNLTSLLIFLADNG